MTNLEVSQKMLSPDEAEFAASLAKAAGGFDAARKTLDGGPSMDRDLWAKLAAVGAWGLLLPDRMGGPGAQLSDQLAVSRILSRVAAPVPVTAAALASAILAGCDGDEAQRLAETQLSASVVVGACLGNDGDAPLSVETRGSEVGELTGTLGLAADVTSLDIIIVEAAGDWWAVVANDSQVAMNALETLDPTRPVAILSLDHAEGRRLGPANVDELRALWWVLLAAESTGAAESAFEMAVDYAKVRVQFGHPIGAFQSIQHKLVDDLIALEAARSSLTLAQGSASVTGIPQPMESHVAKIVACEASAKIMTDAIQVQGAMANTWEHDAHLLLRRAKSAQATAGSPGVHREVLNQMIASQHDGAVAIGGTGLDRASLSSDDLAFLDELRHWLDEHATAERVAELYARDRNKRVEFRRGWQQEMAASSWAGIHWPRANGGREASLGQQMLYHHELASRGLPPLIGNRGLSLIGPTIIAHGSVEQREIFVERTRTAELLWASGLSEREAGSDLAGLQTKGVVDGSDLVINGHKIWTTAAQFADWIFCLVRTNPQAAKHQGITCVLVPLACDGITVSPIRRITGDAEFNEVFFDDVRVPLRNVVGAIDDGWSVARTTLSYEHMTNFLGTQMRLAGTVDRIGKRISEIVDLDPTIRQRHTDAWIDTQLLRVHGLRNVSRLQEGNKPGPEGSILKLYGQELEKRLFELGLDAGMLNAVLDDKWAKGFLGTRASTVGGGTSEVHRNKLAERVLGLPRLEDGAATASVGG